MHSFFLLSAATKIRILLFFTLFGFAVLVSRGEFLFLRSVSTACGTWRSSTDALLCLPCSATSLPRTSGEGTVSWICFWSVNRHGHMLGPILMFLYAPCGSTQIVAPDHTSLILLGGRSAPAGISYISVFWYESYYGGGTYLGQDVSRARTPEPKSCSRILVLVNS